VARTEGDHFVDINEMVGNRMPAVCAGFAGLDDDGDEVAEVGVFEHTAEFARGPEIRPGGIDAFTRCSTSNEERIIHTFCGRTGVMRRSICQSRR